MKRKSNRNKPNHADEAKKCTSGLLQSPLSIDPFQTNVHMKESLHSWPYVIENFSKLPRETGRRVCSPKFEIGKYKFQIELFPGGNTKDCKGYISIYLELCKPKHGLIKFSFSILDLNGEKKVVRSQPLSHEFDLDTPNKNLPFGYIKFVEFSELSTDVLTSTNDQLIVLCEIFDLDASASLYELQKFRLFREHLNNEQYSDLKITIKGQTIYAHKIILATGNEVFSTMIKSDMEVNENGVINVEDTEYEIFVELIRFIYTGQVHNIERMSEKLMIAADKYKVIQLKLKCEQYLIPLLTTVNVLKYLKLADQYDLNLLKKMAISFFVNNRKVIMKSANFSGEIEVLRPGLTAELMLGFSSL